jgi:hypothetical protein
LKRFEDIDFPIEKEADIASATLCSGSNAVDARKAVHRFFDWARDGREHLLRGHYAVVDYYYDAWKIRLREDGYRQLEGGEQTGGAK